MQEKKKTHFFSGSIFLLLLFFSSKMLSIKFSGNRKENLILNSEMKFLPTNIHVCRRGVCTVNRLNLSILLVLVLFYQPCINDCLILAHQYYTLNTSDEARSRFLWRKLQSTEPQRHERQK
uniref:Uncharacterized protein n=1 Tax=Octopus bimaculoides TaxID=37653 RepID=A0A0L8I8L4_OCTBM